MFIPTLLSYLDLIEGLVELDNNLVLFKTGGSDTIVWFLWFEIPILGTFDNLCVIHGLTHH